MIQLRLETRQLIEQELNKTQNDLEYNLNPLQRLSIYQSFGFSRILKPDFTKSENSLPFDVTEEFKRREFYHNEFSKLSFADHVLGWLAISTVQYVLPFWDRHNFENDYAFQPGTKITPHQILQTAQNLLHSTSSFEDAFMAYHEDFYYGGSKVYFTYRLNSIYEAAYHTLGLILLGRYVESELVSYRDEIRISGDFATEAMKAYSVDNSDKPGDWQYFQGVAAHTPALKIDPKKRLEFWEWWLTEAIPQAWDLAEQTYNTNPNNQG